MFERTIATDSVLDRLRAARETELAAAAEQLLLAAAWADLHPAARGEAAAGWGDVDLHGEGLVPLAGEGTPAVAEFAPAELAAHLSITLDAGKLLIGDALELRHRLPRLWDLVHSHTIPAWRARQVASLSTLLIRDARLWVDRMLACDPQHLTLARARRVVDDAVLFFDPDRARATEDSALADRHVRLDHSSGPATTDVHLRLDTIDAQHLDDTVSDLAHRLHQLGDTDPLDVRRARSVGILADPQRALDLLTTHEDTGPSGGTHIQLVLHVSAEHLADHARSGGQLEHLGAVTRNLLVSWLGRSEQTGITVRPVLDLTTVQTIDRHDPPDWMRRAAVLRDATCVFPGCTRDSHRCDLDHIEPYVPTGHGGPPGQTSLANLAPLCRTHHRIKTHGDWHYERLDDGHYLWTAPDGTLLAVHTRRRG